MMSLLIQDSCISLAANFISVKHAFIREQELVRATVRSYHYLNNTKGVENMNAMTSHSVAVNGKHIEEDNI